MYVKHCEASENVNVKYKDEGKAETIAHGLHFSGHEYFKFGGVYISTSTMGQIVPPEAISVQGNVARGRCIPMVMIQIVAEHAL